MGVTRWMGWIVAALLGVFTVWRGPAGAPDVQGRAAARLALQASVVLTRIEQGEGARPFCGGVIRGEYLVLTAFHCVRTTIGEASNRPLGVREFADAPRVKRAVVIWYRAGADLALLRVEEPLVGRVASLVSDVAVGEAIILVGAPQTRQAVGEFMLTRGWVGLIRVERWTNCDGTKPEPFGGDLHQVVWGNVQAHFGNSGGGAFNEAGDLMGVLVRGEVAEADDYVCSDDRMPYRGEDQLWSYIVGPDELRKIPKPEVK